VAETTYSARRSAPPCSSALAPALACLKRQSSALAATTSIPLSNAEADQRDTPGGGAGGDRDERFGDVPGDREPLEPHATALQALAGDESARFHYAASRRVTIEFREGLRVTGNRLPVRFSCIYVFLVFAIVSAA
jgi:hypothetical protein